MHIDDVFSKETIDDFFSKLAADELKSVEDIYFICNPSKSNVARKIRIKSNGSLASWDSKWTSVEIPNGEKDPRNFVKDQNERAEKVYEYYKEHLNEFLDVKTVDGQRRLGQATGETGGSFLFHCKRNEQEIPFKLAKGFIALAKAMNDGLFEMNDFVALSFKIESPIYASRIKFDTNQPLDGELLKKIRQIFESNELSDFSAKAKTNVASYLNWLRPKKGNYVPFESSLKGWNMEIEQLTESVAKVNLGENKNEHA